MSDQTLRLVAAIRARLEATRRRITFLDALAGVLLTIGIWAALWLLLVSLEAGFWLPPAVRVGFLVLLLLAISVSFSYYVFLPVVRFFGLFNDFTEQAVARRIAKAYPVVSDRLINLLQLAKGAHSDAPEPLLDRAMRDLSEEIRPVQFEGVASTSKTKRIARLALIPVTAVVLFGLINPGLFTRASARVLSPNTTFSRPTPFEIRVKPGDIEVIKGDSVVVSAIISVNGAANGAAMDAGRDFSPPISLVTVYSGEVRSHSQLMDTDKSGSYSFTFEGVRQSLSYLVEGGGVRSNRYTINVVERPLVQRLDITLSYPRYARLPAHELEPNVGDISALAGTRAAIELAFGGAEVQTGEIVFSTGKRTPLVIDGRRASASIRISTNIDYRFELVSTDGVSNVDPITYAIQVVEDAPPSAEFNYPDPQSEMNEEALVPFAVRFSDDYGFSSIALFARLAESRFDSPQEEFTSVPIPLERPYLLDQILEYSWDLRAATGFDPIPGDIIEYFVRVWDNDSVSGFKSSSTSTYTVRFPSLAEQYEQLDLAKDDTENELENLVDEARDIREQFEKLKEDLRQKPESDWQDERRLEQLQQRQEELESSVEDISEGIQDIVEEMTQNDLVSDETIDMFQELREVIEEINSPEMMQALQDLEESLQQMDLSKIQQNLEEFEFNEKMYSDRLERTLELFKNLRLQQDLEEAEKRTEDLVELEDRIEEETAGLQNKKDRQDAANPPDDAQPPEGEPEMGAEDSDRLAAEQDQAARDMEALEKKLKEIRERMEELNSGPTEKMQDLEEDTLDRELPKQMQQNAEDIRDQKFERAQNRQQQMQEQLRQLQSQLGQMQQNMAGQQMQVNMTGLRASLEDLLTLSERQEALRIDVAGMRSEGPRLRESAQDQVELSEGLTVVADSLQRLARKIPQMSRNVQQQAGDALREMGAAVAALSDRSSRRATGHQKGAMTHLNELALILSDLLNQMMNSQASSGGEMSLEQLMEQLQNMGQQQEQLNDQIQQLLNDQQGNRLTNDMVERMRQLGSQQDQIRRDLKQINRDRAARNKLLGDLNRLAEQMQESVQELMQNRTSRQLMQRQRQILSRLLEASRSLQEKGKEKKRQSRTGTDLDRRSPADLTSIEQVEKLRRELFRALESGYASDFEQLIRRYFELLQQRVNDE
ncbi:MAG: hypothetical protein BMS9Abin05_0296 [Rhodothermia bacterium]|nr:MAG: hypothetical protein BMS9Abin05_0296 [Rhodothermia bacterium]